MLSGLVCSQWAKADFEFKEERQAEMAATAGTFLPWGGLRGVRDQYRMWGLTYFQPTDIWDLEYQFLTARGHGVVYHTVSAGLRVDFVIEKVLEVFLLCGLDYHRYQRAPYRGQTYDFVNTGGIHLGFGGFFSLFDRLRLRGELKFHNGPGKTIYIGVGPSFIF